MEKLGIIGAEEQEIALLKPFFTGQILERAGLAFYDGQIFEKPVTFVKAGIGKVSAAMCAQLLISEFGVKAIINSGIAGSIGAGLKVLDIVVGERAIQHDVDASFFGYALGQVPGTDSPFWYTDKALSGSIEKAFSGLRRVGSSFFVNQVPPTEVHHKPPKPETNSNAPSQSADELSLDIANARLHFGTIATGDAFIADEAARSKVLKACPEALCVEMEGASIAQVASANRVPFAILRTISDNSDEGEKTEGLSYDVFSRRAAKLATAIILQVIHEG